ncbi:MAG TPA: YihY/virulence factor BrkB family protein [Anaerolineaceae bacterium]|nr:YihY/virulence factor BrkB family protein [Anaerolineaceae bacterium]
MGEGERQAVIELVKLTFKEWSDDRAPRLAAALSYYTIFAVGPFLIILIALVGILYSRDVIQTQVLDEIGRLIGEEGRNFVTGLITASQQTGGGVTATILGTITLLVGALGIFGELQNSLNTILNVKLKPTKGVKGTAARLVTSRLLSFAMLLVIGFLLLVSMVLTAAIAGLQRWIGSQLPVIAPGVQGLNFILSLLITALLFALIFKYLPDVIIAWKDVLIGGLVTAFLFNVGKQLIGLYLGNSRIQSIYGAAGVVVVILIWIYYSAQIVFLGAEFTQVYANRYGSKVLPDKRAVPIDVTDRLKQGMEP